MRGTNWLTADRCDGTLVKVQARRRRGERRQEEADRPRPGRQELSRQEARRRAEARVLRGRAHGAGGPSTRRSPSSSGLPNYGRLGGRDCLVRDRDDLLGADPVVRELDARGAVDRVEQRLRPEVLEQDEHGGQHVCLVSAPPIPPTESTSITLSQPAMGDANQTAYLAVEWEDDSGSEKRRGFSRSRSAHDFRRLGRGLARATWTLS